MLLERNASSFIWSLIVKYRGLCWNLCGTKFEGALKGNRCSIFLGIGIFLAGPSRPIVALSFLDRKRSSWSRLSFRKLVLVRLLVAGWQTLVLGAEFLQSHSPWNGRA